MIAGRNQLTGKEYAEVNKLRQVECEQPLLMLMLMLMGSSFAAGTDGH